MITQEEIARALDGTRESNATIAGRLGCSVDKVRRARVAAGIPAYKRGRRPSAESWEEAFDERTIAVDGEHLHWTGTRQGNTPILHRRSRTQTAYRYSFTVHNGREPVGNVWPTCGYEGCVAGAHLADRLRRLQRAGRAPT